MLWFVKGVEESVFGNRQGMAKEVDSFDPAYLLVFIVLLVYLYLICKLISCMNNLAHLNIAR